ncbi:condensin-2 complex subunit D3-like [Ahaetulla prasina]|uniref:condensin-2 complex subunit D3-like n=1 Tax=Ahaetulla prasina TaxID=499056 RepID=UPI002647759C|nr:condensin-2 complex subunit D3-like [Ahaetulla prasina]
MPHLQETRVMMDHGCNIINAGRDCGRGVEEKEEEEEEDKENEDKNDNNGRGILASFYSLNRPSSVTKRPLEGRAISTPEQSINNVTFGAGVSQISLNLTSPSCKVKEPETSQEHIICLTSPDKLLPQPPQWRVTSPRRSSPSSLSLRRSSRRTPRQPTK